MTPDEIGKQLAEAADSAFPPDTGGEAQNSGTASLAETLLNDLRPVRPLVAPWVWTLLLAAVAVVCGAAIAMVLGTGGFRALSTNQRPVIFSALLGAMCLAAVACVHEMRPAGGRHLGGLALASVLAGFPIAFALLFENYSTQDFAAEGIPCLEAGLWVALPTSLLAVWILRRGFVLKWSTAGMAAGILSGLAGLGMLELHCANLKAIHVMTWHVAVVLVSGLAGVGFGQIADSFRADKSRASV